MENPEEILHSLEEFAKLKPKDIPRELEDYLCFVAKTGDPVYQWSVIKSLFREKLINVITEFYESCPSVDIPPCPNVDIFNYDTMKSFILEKLDTFVAAPFTVQRICELLTTPRKEYNRIDKYMRALEKNILVVSTTEPGSHRAPENGDGFINGIESDHLQEGTNDINIEMEDSPVWAMYSQDNVLCMKNSEGDSSGSSSSSSSSSSSNEDPFASQTPAEPTESTNTNAESVITCCPPGEQQPYVSIEPVNAEAPPKEEVPSQETDVSVTITAIPAAVQKRRDSIEPPTEQTNTDATECGSLKEDAEVEERVKDEVTTDRVGEKCEEEPDKVREEIIEQNKATTLAEDGEESKVESVLTEIQDVASDVVESSESNEAQCLIPIECKSEASPENVDVEVSELLKSAEESLESTLKDDDSTRESISVLKPEPDSSDSSKYLDDINPQVDTTLPEKSNEIDGQIISDNIDIETQDNITSTTEVPEEEKLIPMDVDAQQINEDTADTTPTNFPPEEN